MKARFWTSVYLVVLVWPIPGFLASGPSPAGIVAVVAGVAGFAGLYLRVAWTALERPHRNATPYALILLYALAAAMAPALGVMWVFASSFFLITAVATALPERALPLAAGATIAAGTAALPLLGESPAELWWIPLQAAVFTAAIRAFLRLNAANRALSEANVKVERLAVDNERLRFARDMHDLLGHSLAVMTVKSQLAARLADADPARARAEMEQVEELSRQALAEVREAISGYRELSLPDELDGARRALGTAGVRLEVAAGPLPPAAEPVLAWVVREGTTNVVRHSGARACRIRLGVADGQAYAEVRDDGRGSEVAGDECGGNGLRGLAERIEVAGGTLTSGPAEDGGFLLNARIPVPGTAPLARDLPSGPVVIRASRGGRVQPPARTAPRDPS
ncbi:sensor histidine kinase [Nonomuraea salmonea]|uniref:Sensor histidine kinase n=1 Tax=Nonomuraea salmonea TaxID=46181 RepID=A0ABV5P3J6_9ACTN